MPKKKHIYTVQLHIHIGSAWKTYYFGLCPIQVPGWRVDFHWKHCKTVKSWAETYLSKMFLAINSCKKSRIRETPTLLTDADSRTNTNFKRLHDLSIFFYFFLFLFFFYRLRDLSSAYGRHQLSRPMRIVGPIQILRGCVIYQKFKIKI